MVSQTFGRSSAHLNVHLHRIGRNYRRIRNLCENELIKSLVIQFLPAITRQVVLSCRIKEELLSTPPPPHHPPTVRLMESFIVLRSLQTRT